MQTCLLQIAKAELHCTTLCTLAVRVAPDVHSTWHTQHMYNAFTLEGFESLPFGAGVFYAQAVTFLSNSFSLQAVTRMLLITRELHRS